MSGNSNFITGDKAISIKIPINPPQEIFTPAIGYSFVGFCCIYAGICMRNGNILAEPSQVLEAIYFTILSFPFFLNRQIIQENCDEFAKGWLHPLASDLPLLFLASALLIVLFAVSFYHLIRTAHFDDTTVLRDILRYFIGLLPFLILAVFSTLNWTTKGGTRCFLFTYRSFFPALATCAISFIFGWSIGNGIMGLVIAVFIFVVYFGLSFIKSMHWVRTLWIIGLIIIIVITILSFAFPSNIRVGDIAIADYFRVCTFGALISLQMGIFESWRITWQKYKLYDADSPQLSKCTNGIVRDYVKGTNAATSIFPPLFLTTIIIHPGTNWIFHAYAFLIVIAQVLFWYATHDRFRVKQAWVWGMIGLFSGFAVPLLVIFGTDSEYSAVIPRIANIAQNYSVQLLIASLGVIVFIFWDPKGSRTDVLKRGRRLFIKEPFARGFHDKAFCIRISALVCLGMLDLSILVFLLTPIFFPSYNIEDFYLGYRLNLLFLSYIITAVVLALIEKWPRFLRIDISDIEQEAISSQSSEGKDTR